MYKIMLDSGAWSAYTHGEKINVDKYIRFIYDNRRLIDHYVNLDVIGDGRASLNNYRVMRDNGLNPIPVFHAGTSVRFLYKYLEYTDYVAVGAIAKMHTSSRIANLDKHIWPKIVDRRGYPIAKFHGFGLTSLKIMKYYPWYSVDSSSWVQYGRYGIVLVPPLHRKTGDWDYKGEPIKLVVSSRKEKHPKHFINLPDGIQKDTILRYFEENGFDYKTLSTHHISRDKLNLVYYLGIQDQVLSQWPRRYELWKRGDGFYAGRKVERDRVMGMNDRKDDNVIYIAGNFPVMKDIEEERAIKDKYPTRFNRLISYFFQEDIKTVLQLKREEIDGTESKGATQQT